MFPTHSCNSCSLSGSRGPWGVGHQQPYRFRDASLKLPKALGVSLLLFGSNVLIPYHCSLWSKAWEHSLQKKKKTLAPSGDIFNALCISMTASNSLPMNSLPIFFWSLFLSPLCTIYTSLLSYLFHHAKHFQLLLKGKLSELLPHCQREVVRGIMNIPLHANQTSR